MMFWFDRHRRLRDQLSAYIDAALDPAAAGRLEAHLKECARCRTELKELRSTVAALQELPEAPVPRSFSLSPERAAVRRPAVAAAPLAFGARIAAAGVAAALAAVLVVDFGDLGGDGAMEEVSAPQMMAEREADEGGMEGEGAAPAEAPEPFGTPAAPEAGDDDAEGAFMRDEAPAASSPVPTLPPDVTVIVPGEEPSPRGLTPEPEAGIEKAAAVGEGGGGIDALTAAEIGLAAALAVLVGSSLVLAFARRKR